ncbi:hypothetical protein LTR85_007187 [Meristemomyces frigidus]|nr:hypothetical protein LTR85_007187 [Meristemomyces frigidus]
MFALTLIAALATSASTLPLPQDGGGVFTPFPSNTTITYCQGSTASDICSMSVGTGTLAAEVCTPLEWSGIGIAQSPNNSCSFTLFTGTTSCDSNATTEKTGYAVPRGEGVTCVDVGVLDGGRYQKASGVWSCG